MQMPGYIIRNFDLLGADLSRQNTTLLILTLLNFLQTLLEMKL